MRKIEGYDSTEAIKELSSGVLPKGGYEMIILGVYLNHGNRGDYLQFDMDVCEGEFKGFFDKQYKEQTAEKKNWRCKYFLSIPVEDGTDGDMFKLRVFKTFMTHVEDSNPGFKWSWDEKTLRNRKIGGLFVNNEYLTKDGQVRTGTVLARTCSIQDIIDNTFKLPKDKTLSSGTPNNTEDSGFKEVAELPFS